MLNFIYSNITRADMTSLINYYNYSLPQEEHIVISPTQEDIEITKYCESQWNEDGEQELSDSEAISVVDKIIDEAIETPAGATPSVQVSSRPASPSGDHVPPWLGMPGFEERTTEWIAEQASERAQSLATSAEEEERRQERLTILEGTTIENSKTRLLDLLSKYADEVQRGKIRITEEVRLVLEGVIVYAKGKYQKIDDPQPIEFVSMLEYQNSLLEDLKTREDVIMYTWWCYSRQCAATDTGIDEAVIVAAKIIIALAADRTEEEVAASLLSKNAADEDIAMEVGTEEHKQRAGYEALKQVLAKQDKRYSKYPEEILQEASVKSGVDVETILAQASEAQETKV
jgi:hypothetical protein